MSDESPGFYFNVEKWRGSRSVQRMSFAERGVYLEMMIEQWLRKSLPDDAQTVALEIGISDEQSAVVVAAWPVVRRKFATDTAGRIYNVPLEQVRRKQRANRRAKQIAGQRGGRAAASRRHKPLKTDGILASSATADSSGAIAEGSDQRREEESRAEQSRDEQKGLLQLTARSKRPIFKGQRFVVFEWMLEDLMRMLGAFTDDFDLHEWFYAADALALKEPAVVSDWWPWLKAKTLAEAHRRGLPIAVAASPLAGKQTTRLAAAVAKIAREG